ncbi:MAG: 4Fe-4S binding protein [bacterium]|nr:4Fe-4S binding protein [bacterium]
MTTRLTAAAEGCSGCRVCQLVCALTHVQENNVKKAAIGIRGYFPAPGRYEVEVCDQCGQCATVCPEEAIVLQDGAWTIDSDRCSGCGVCVDSCPRGVIFRHPDRAVPVKCDACGECVPFCSRGVLAIQKEGDT